MQTQTEF